MNWVKQRVLVIFYGVTSHKVRNCTSSTKYHLRVHGCSFWEGNCFGTFECKTVKLATSIKDHIPPANQRHCNFRTKVSLLQDEFSTIIQLLAERLISHNIDELHKEKDKKLRVSGERRIPFHERCFQAKPRSRLLCADILCVCTSFGERERNSSLKL